MLQVEEATLHHGKNYVAFEDVAMGQKLKTISFLYQVVQRQCLLVASWFLGLDYLKRCMLLCCNLFMLSLLINELVVESESKGSHACQKKTS